MGKKNWIEFNNQESNFLEKTKIKDFRKISKISISKQKKGKKGKTITLIKGLEIENYIGYRELLKKLKVFCGTGGTIIDSEIQLQGDMVIKSTEFLRREGFQNL